MCMLRALHTYYTRAKYEFKSGHYILELERKGFSAHPPPSRPSVRIPSIHAAAMCAAPRRSGWMPSMSIRQVTAVDMLTTRSRATGQAVGGLRLSLSTGRPLEDAMCIAIVHLWPHLPHLGNISDCLAAIPSSRAW